MIKMNSTEKIDTRNISLSDLAKMYESGEITRAYVVVVDDAGKVHAIDFNQDCPSS